MEFVSWDDDIPNIWKNKSHVPNHQPVYVPFILIWYILIFPGHEPRCPLRFKARPSTWWDWSRRPGPPQREGPGDAKKHPRLISGVKIWQTAMYYVWYTIWWYTLSSGISVVYYNRCTIIVYVLYRYIVYYIMVIHYYISILINVMI